MQDCEWNPDLNVPALVGEESHAEATLFVGSKRDGFMLCASCANLPYFRGVSRKELLRPQPTTNDETRG